MTTGPAPGRRRGAPAAPVLAAVTAGREAALRRRRRPGLWAAGAALVALGGLAAAGLVSRAGDRVEVLAVARTVQVGQMIAAEDVTVARVPADAALRPVPAAERDRVVGRVAAVELRPGTLLTAAEVTDSAVPGAGEQVVGVLAKPGQLPARGLRAGDRVFAVPVPGDQAGNQAGTDTTIADLGSPVPARVVQVGPPDADGVVTVDLVVGQDTGPRLAALASTGRLALVLLPAQGR